MKKVLLYAWGVFLAVAAGAATATAIQMVFGYIDDRVSYYLLEIAPDKFPSPYITLLKHTLFTSEYQQSWTVAFAVTVLTFERWRQRQQQIWGKGGNTP